MHRSHTLRPLGKNVEYRISRHQNYKKVGDEMKPHGDPYPVVGLFFRDPIDGELKPLDTFRMEQFIELNREVVRVGRDLVPADGDEASVS